MCELQKSEEETVYHKNFWTVEKIGRRLSCSNESQVVYRRSVNCRHSATRTARQRALAGCRCRGGCRRSHGWAVIEPNSYWGKRYTNFMLRTTFAVPADWPADQAVALYLPLGEAGDFSHPETLAYIDGVAYAAGDRHHQEDSACRASGAMAPNTCSTCTAGAVSSAMP